VAIIADVDRSEAWAEASGMRSLEHWVTWQCGFSANRARELVQTARRRDDLPLCSALFDAGSITEDATSAIARRVPAERDEGIAAQAPHYLFSQLQRVLALLPRPTPEPKPEPEGPRREVSFGTGGDRWRARADLPLDEGKLIEEALRAARSSVFHERHPDVEGNEENPHASGVSWADALWPPGRVGAHRAQDLGRQMTFSLVGSLVGLSSLAWAIAHLAP